MRQELDHDEVSLVIRATPAALYDLVTDITRTRISALKSSGRNGSAATGPAVGARFKAYNTPRRGPAWSTKPVITVAHPGREFAFTRTVLFAGTLEWRYRFIPENGATRVIESYTVIKPITTVGWFVVTTVFGETQRKAALRAGMQETLRRIKAATEEHAVRQSTWSAIHDR